MTNRFRRTHPSPASFAQEVEDLIDSLDDLIPLYAEADEYVWGQRDENRGTTGKISGTGTADPTGSIVASQEGNKRQLKGAMEDLQRMKAIIDGTAKNGWNGIREKLLRIFDPAEYESLASFRSAATAGPDRREQALAGKIQRFGSRLRRLERVVRRAG